MCCISKFQWNILSESWVIKHDWARGRLWNIPLTTRRANPSRSFVLIIPEAALGERLKLKLIWSIWNLQQRYPMPKDIDWWRHGFTQLTYVYFTDHSINHLRCCQQKLKCEAIKLIPSLDSKIWHGPYFSIQIFFSKFWAS